MVSIRLQQQLENWRNQVKNFDHVTTTIATMSMYEQHGDWQNLKICQGERAEHYYRSE